MKKFFNWILVLGACVAAFYLIGLIVPRSQSQGSKTNLSTKPEAVYEVVADVSNWSRWHPEVSSAVERPSRNDHPVWMMTDKLGQTYELEVQAAEEGSSWAGTYTIDGTRTTLRFDFSWYGEGGRVRITKSKDTRDPWIRARRFLWSKSEASPVTLLNALATHLGETADAEENN